MSRNTAGNWVDRGEPAIPKLRKSLSFYFQRFDETDIPWLDEHATIVYGMVIADATDVQIAGYLRGVMREVGFPEEQPLGTRLFALSMWHMAKAALVRDDAARVMQREQLVLQEKIDSLQHELHQLQSQRSAWQRLDLHKEHAGNAVATTDGAYAD